MSVLALVARIEYPKMVAFQDDKVFCCDKGCFCAKIVVVSNDDHVFSVSKQIQKLKKSDAAW
jgi:hypothetical protein